MVIKKLKDFDTNDFKSNLNKVFNVDCIEFIERLDKNSIDLLLTDIPYEKVNKRSNGLRKLDKKKANKKTFEVKKFLERVEMVTKGSGYIFCGKEQVSEIFEYFDSRGITTRLMIWEKSNPSPMNCQHVWMSGIECFIYFKKRGAIFNEFYKNSVLKFPNGISKVHPTQKPIKLFEYLIKVSSKKGDIVFDPCLGSGTTFFASLNLGRNFIGCELEGEFCNFINSTIIEINEPDKKNKKIEVLNKYE